MMNPIADLRNSWNRFWFDSRSDDTLTVLSLFRICFCIAMLICYVARIADVDFFYSDRGILPGWYNLGIEAAKYHPSFLTHIESPFQLQVLHTIFLLSLFSLMLGFQTRISAILVYFLNLMFHNRNMSVMFGVDMIASFYFLYLCFADCNHRFSIDAHRKKDAKKQSLRSHIAWRLMQVQLCVVYGFSGLEKLKGVRWWDGSAMWDVFQISNMQRFDLSFVVHFPVILALMVYVVLFWEIYFPVLIWQKKMRLYMLLFGTQMHLGIWIFMNLPSFAFMMMSLYVLFLTKEELIWGLSKLIPAKLIPIRS